MKTKLLKDQKYKHKNFNIKLRDINEEERLKFKGKSIYQKK